MRIIRPGNGLHPKFFYLLEGMKLQKDVNFGEPVSSVDFHEGSRLIAKKSQDFKLVEVEANEEHTLLLFEHLKKRSKASNISHSKMPTLEEHKMFLKHHPYRNWWLIYDLDPGTEFLGTVYIASDNSIGLHLNLDQIDFSALYFINKLKSMTPPMKGEESRVFGDYFFNVSPKNKELIHWLSISGFAESQRSFVLR